MTLTEQIFGKEFSKITLDDLRNFFREEQEESAILEFKEGAIAIEKIYKEVCAFLNTEGGVLIIGTPREQNNAQGNKKYCAGELTPSTFRSGEWLVQKLAGNISPAPIGIKIRDFITDSGNYFILDIPQSITPPHQSGDGVYYIRLDKEAKPAPHGLIEALFFKRQKSKLKVKSTIRLNEYNSNLYTNTINIINESTVPAEKVSYSITVKNIKSVALADFSKDVNDIYTHSKTLDIVLWKGLDVSFSFDIEPFDEPFFLLIRVWSRDSEGDMVYGIFDPTSDKMLKNTADFKNSGGIPEALETLQKLLYS